MPELKKILVGIDFLGARHGNLSSPVAEAVKQATWLAQCLSCEMTYLAAVELPTGGEIHPPEITTEPVAREIENSAREALGKLVDSAAERGLKATSKFVAGQGWVELTKGVIRGGQAAASGQRDRRRVTRETRETGLTCFL